MVKGLKELPEKMDKALTKNARKKINEIVKYNGVSHNRYLRNLNRYVNSRMLRNDLNTLYDLIQVPYLFYDDEVTQFSVYNLIRSCVETVQSKISQSRVRPTLNSVDGTFRVQKVCKQAQHFFDVWYDNCDVYRLAAIAARDAMVFDKGILHINDDTEKIENILPWNFGVNPYEFAHEKPSGCYKYFEKYPTCEVASIFEKKGYSIDFEKDTCKFYVYYDLKNKKKYYLIDGEFRYVEDIDYDIMPFVFMYWEEPMKGYYSTSLCDTLYPLQVRIDKISNQINEAFDKSLKHIVFFPESTNIKASKISNEIGLGVPYRDIPGQSGMPITVYTPSAISDQYINERQMLIEQGFNFAGVSKLSSQSENPSGVDSGVAMRTLENVESERFNTFQHSYINALRNCAEVAMQVLPKNANILPNNTLKIKWSEVCAAKDSFSIQFSGGDAFSKDPAKKQEEILTLMQSGLIDQRVALSMIELPDRERTLNIANASYDYCETIISNAVENNDYNFYPVVNFKTLEYLCASYIMRMASNDGDKKEIDRINKLYMLVLNIEKETNDAVNQAQQAQAQQQQAQLSPMPGMSVAPQPTR